MRVSEPSPNQQQAGSDGQWDGVRVSLDAGMTKPERTNGSDK